MEILKTLIIFIVSISILVGIHEFGHYLAARISGVRVLHFSIGFGPKIFGWTSKKTGILYTFSSIPLGGFVRMLLKKEAEDENSPYYGEINRTFDNAPLWNRFWITFWGPLTNGILAVVILAAIGIGQKSYMPPILGDSYGIAKEAGFQKEDIVKSINSKEIETWTDLMLELALATGQKENTFEINRNGENLKINTDFSSVKISRDNSNYDYILGFHSIVERGNKINFIENDSPAKKSGLLTGDRIVSIGKVKTPKISFITNELNKRKNENVELTVLRNNKEKKIIVSVSEFGKIGISLDFEINKEEVKNLYKFEEVGILESVGNSIETTYNMSIVTVKFLWKIITKETSVTSLSGPVTMAKATETGFSNGLNSYLYIIAMLSINLMVLNLLPIPVLDGGHIAFTLVESVFGPVPERVQSYITAFFGILLIVLMLSVSLYDIYKTIF